MIDTLHDGRVRIRSNIGFESSTTYFDPRSDITVRMFPQGGQIVVQVDKADGSSLVAGCYDSPAEARRDVSDIERLVEQHPRKRPSRALWRGLKAASLLLVLGTGGALAYNEMAPPRAARQVQIAQAQSEQEAPSQRLVVPGTKAAQTDEFGLKQ